jgi:hypothetical protein
MGEMRWAATAWTTAAALAGCAGQVGPTRTEVIDVPRPADLSQAWDLELQLGAADSTVRSHAQGLVKGTIAYNVDRLKPVLAVTDRRVIIRQDADGPLPGRTRNEWRLQLGRGVPLRLKVTTGASRDDWDLGGLSLRRLTWIQGAGRAALVFSEPNPEALDQLEIDAGASELSVRGLANANIGSSAFNAGAGLFTLSFDGRLSRDGEVVLNGGGSMIDIHSGGNPIRLTVEGPPGAVESRGWSQAGGLYFSPEWATASGPKLAVRARLGLSALRLIAG